MALKFCISERHTHLSQLLWYLQNWTEVDYKLFPSLSKDTVVKITLCLIKRHFPSENDVSLSNMHDN